jgi:phosphohistidine phosphatase SixA
MGRGKSLIAQSLCALAINNRSTPMLKPIVLALLLSSATIAAAEPTQVIVVRHAERAAEPKDDPALSAEGAARAELLAETLKAANISTIITTHYRRTNETAAPLAKRLGITPSVIAIRRGELPAHIAEVAAAVRKASGAVLVVGHSNTVADIVAALSSSKPVKLCETTFSNLFIVTPSAPQLPAVQLKYGTPDVPPSAECQ